MARPTGGRVLLVADGAILRDISYRLRVLDGLGELVRAGGGERVRLLVFGRGSRREWEDLSGALASAGVGSVQKVAARPVRGLGLLTRAMSALVAAWRLRRLLRGGVSVVQAEGLAATLPVLPFLRGARPVPLLLDYRGPVPEGLVLGGPRTGRFLFPLLTRWEAFVLARARGVLCPSEESRAYLVGDRGVAEGKVKVLPNRVDPRPFEAAVRGREALRKTLGLEGKFVLLHLGGLEPAQLPDRVLALFLALHRQLRESHLLLLTRDLARLRTLLRRHSPPRGSVTAAAVAHEEVAGYIAVADLGFLLRADRLHSRLGLPRKLGEYLLAGVPVCTTAGAGEAARWVAEGGVGCLIDPEEVEEGVKRILAFRERYRREREGIREACRALGRARWARQEGCEYLLPLYREILGADDPFGGTQERA